MTKLQPLVVLQKLKSKTTMQSFLIENADCKRRKERNNNLNYITKGLNKNLNPLTN